jgi:glucose dehydrogenase
MTQTASGEVTMHWRQHRSLRSLLFMSAAALAAASAVAADITPARLANPEPGNWLMNHRTYDAQRYSPLDRINRTNVKNLGLPMRLRSAARRQMPILNRRRLPRKVSSTS